MFALVAYTAVKRQRAMKWWRENTSTFSSRTRIALGDDVYCQGAVRHIASSPHTGCESVAAGLHKSTTSKAGRSPAFPLPITSTASTTFIAAARRSIYIAHGVDPLPSLKKPAAYRDSPRLVCSIVARAEVAVKRPAWRPHPMRHRCKAVEVHAIPGLAMRTWLDSSEAVRTNTPAPSTHSNQAVPGALKNPLPVRSASPGNHHPAPPSPPGGRSI
jgi:hypothetical protein